MLAVVTEKRRVEEVGGGQRLSRETAAEGTGERRLDAEETEAVERREDQEMAETMISR
jgi:hypothetical protein